MRSSSRPSSSGNNHSVHSSSPRSSNEDLSSDTLAPLRLEPTMHQPGIMQVNHSSVSTAESDRELHSFVDRFRTMVSQISRETEEALVFATSDVNRSESPSDLEDDIFTRMPSRTLGYNEFGQPYPPDYQVRILNGYVRRMPTIESLGSREVASIASSTHNQDILASIHTLSRPPTRANTLSMSDYSPTDSPTRASSLSFAAGILSGGTTDLGELIEKMQQSSDTTRTRLLRTSSSQPALSISSSGTGTTASRSTTLSYHTAGSISPVLPSPSALSDFSGVTDSSSDHHGPTYSIPSQSGSSIDGAMIA